MALTGICVHHVDAKGDMQDYLLGLPQLHGKHSGENIAAIVKSTFETFEIDQKCLGYFVLDNATNNDTALERLGGDYSFEKTSRRLRCTCHILNLAAQLVIWGRDSDSFENSYGNLSVSLVSILLVLI